MPNDNDERNADAAGETFGTTATPNKLNDSEEATPSAPAKKKQRPNSDRTSDGEKEPQYYYPDEAALAEGVKNHGLLLEKLIRADLYEVFQLN